METGPTKKAEKRLDPVVGSVQSLGSLLVYLDCGNCPAGKEREGCYSFCYSSWADWILSSRGSPHRVDPFQGPSLRLMTRSGEGVVQHIFGHHRD